MGFTKQVKRFNVSTNNHGAITPIIVAPGARILSAVEVDGRLALHIETLVNDNGDLVDGEKKTVMVFQSGKPLPAEATSLGRFIATVVIQPNVWHVYETAF